MSTRLQLLIGLLLLVIGLALGRYYTPEKVVTKTVIQTNTVEVTHDHVVTVVKEVTALNGTKTKTTTTIDLSVINSNTDSTTQTQKTVTRDNPQWKTSVQFSSSSVLPDYLYGVTVERRIIGPVFIGVFGNANRQFGASIGMEF